MNDLRCYSLSYRKGIALDCGVPVENVLLISRDEFKENVEEDEE